MNSINNNNIGNPKYGFENNNNSNAKKEEESIFDKVLDSISDFFGDEEEEEKKVANSNNLDKAYMMKLQSSNTYTLAPMKNQETLTERWAKENENVELKQKEKEIAKLQQNINTLRSKNKLLEKQNEMMYQSTQQKTGVEQTTGATQAAGTQVAQEISSNTEVKQVEKGLPTHTSIPKSVLEQQQNEIAEVSASTKVEPPKKEVEEAKASAAPKTITEQHQEEVKA